MKKLILLTSLLLTPIHVSAAQQQSEVSDDGPFTATVRTVARGAVVATAGYGLKELVNFSTANYTLTFPSSVVPTTKSRLWLAALGFIGAGLVLEKIYLGNQKSCFERFLTFSDNGKNRRIGNIVEVGIVAATGYKILTTAAHQSPVDAVACIAAGGLLKLLY